VQGYMMKTYLADPRNVMVSSKVMNGTVQHANSVMEPLVNKDGTRIMYLPNGTSVQVVGIVSSMTVNGISETYLHVMYSGISGYLPQRYVQTSGSQPTTTATAYIPAVTATPVPTEAPWSGPTYGTHPISVWPLTQPTGCKVGYINNPNPMDRLNLRKSPSGNATSLGKYYNGTQVIILGDDTQEWVYVQIGNLTGYVKTIYLETDPAYAPESVLPIMTVNTNKLNLRENQSTSSASLAQYSYGKQVVLIGFNGTWAHVIVDGQYGFMMGKYLK